VTAIGFLTRALAFYRRYGIEVERLISDNGAAYRSRLHAIASASSPSSLRTRPYRPQTNGKAERFIRTLLGGLGLRRDRRLKHRTHRRPRRMALARQPSTPTLSPQPATPVTRTNQLGSYN
jgi:transposase InsO family protein